MFIANWCVKLLSNFCSCISWPCSFLHIVSVNVISMMTVFLSRGNVLSFNYSVPLPLSCQFSQLTWSVNFSKTKKEGNTQFIEVTHARSFHWGEIVWEAWNQAAWCRVTKWQPQRDKVRTWGRSRENFSWGVFAWPLLIGNVFPIWLCVYWMLWGKVLLWKIWNSFLCYLSYLVSCYYGWQSWYFTTTLRQISEFIVL